MDKDIDVCHIVGCSGPAVEMEWFPDVGVCFHVCAEHAFATLSDDARMDLARAVADHKRNAAMYNGSVEQ